MAYGQNMMMIHKIVHMNIEHTRNYEIAAKFVKI